MQESVSCSALAGLKQLIQGHLAHAASWLLCDLLLIVHGIDSAVRERPREADSRDRQDGDLQLPPRGRPWMRTVGSVWQGLCAVSGPPMGRRPWTRALWLTCARATGET